MPTCNGRAGRPWLRPPLDPPWAAACVPVLTLAHVYPRIPSSPPSRSHTDSGTGAHPASVPPLRVAAPAPVVEGERAGETGALSVTGAQRAELLRTLAEAGFVETVFSTYTRLIAHVGAHDDAEPAEESLFSATKAVVSVTDLLASRLALRPGSFDLKPKSDGPHARELRSLLSTGAVVRSLLSASNDLLALAEGDTVHCISSKLLQSEPPSDRMAALRSTSKTVAGFEILAVSFNPADESQLLVSGLRECVALTLGRRGEVASRLDLMIDSLSTGVHIVRAMWLPGSATRVALLTTSSSSIAEGPAEHVDAKLARSCYAFAFTRACAHMCPQPTQVAATLRASACSTWPLHKFLASTSRKTT